MPAATPLITPEEELIVATAPLLLLQLPLLTELLKVVEPPTQIACVPLSEPALGGAVVVTLAVRLALIAELQPSLARLVMVTVVLPVLARLMVLKLPLPAVATVMLAVRPLPVLAPVRL